MIDSVPRRCRVCKGSGKAYPVEVAAEAARHRMPHGAAAVYLRADCPGCLGRGAAKKRHEDAIEIDRRLDAEVPAVPLRGGPRPPALSGEIGHAIA